MILAYMPGPVELGILMVMAVLMFGKRLPEVARQVGRGMAELKKGMSSIQSELNSAIYSDTQMSNYSSSSTSRSRSYDDADDREEQTAPKFEPPPAEPEVKA